MSWNVAIMGQTSGDPTSVGRPLGTLKEVRNAIKKHLPESVWWQPDSGACYTSEWKINIDLRGEPVEYVSLDVTQYNSTKLKRTLVAMANEYNWVAIDESGDPIESHSGREANPAKKVAAKKKASVKKASPKKASPKKATAKKATAKKASAKKKVPVRR